MSVRLDHGKDELDEVHEINVTPFIDVMLVLLIIFMVAAPLATVDIAVDLRPRRRRRRFGRRSRCFSPSGPTSR
jgi:biopolymer transport protein ExbD